jgi:Xaa-Pro dipeptidase
MVRSFPIEEYRARIEFLVVQLKHRGLAGILLFAPESMRYFTGYEALGHVQFRVLFVGADRRTTLITHFADDDLMLATAVIDEVKPWGNGAKSSLAETLGEAIARQIGPEKKRIGAEDASIIINTQRGMHLEAWFARTLHLVDASDLVPTLCLQKSNAELAYVRRAAGITDTAFRHALTARRPGGSQADFLAELYRVVACNGGDPGVSPCICRAGDSASPARQFGAEGTIAPVDRINIEFTAAYRHYQVALTRTILRGCASTEQSRMHAAAVDALEACRRTLRSGKTFGDVFDAHAVTLDRRGYHRSRMNACGYSLGPAHPRTWMEWPMARAGNSVELAPGMVVFLNIGLLDIEANAILTLGESYVVTGGAPERLSTLDYSIIEQ